MVVSVGNKEVCAAGQLRFGPARMSDVKSVAANTTIDNVLAGKIYEFARAKNNAD
jgi:hypothetical protein